MRQIKKVEKYGLKFDSRLELFFYELCRSEKLDFEFQVLYELHPPFKYQGKAVRAMTLTVDFDFQEHGKNVIVDTKGFQRNDNKLKWKLLKYALSTESHPHIFLPKNQTECKDVVDFIKKLKK
jgi:protein associated with RNAse G/E